MNDHVQELPDSGGSLKAPVEQLKIYPTNGMLVKAEDVSVGHVSWSARKYS